MKNDDLINDFMRFLSLHDIGEKRQEKYRYSLGKISNLLNKDFDKTDKEDIENLIINIDNNGFSDWTKHDYRVIIKKFFTWMYNKDNDDLDSWDIPSLVKWIKIKAPKNSKKLPSELINPQDIRLLVENSRDLREKALILTLYESGARIGELLNCKIKDFNPDKYGCVLTLFGKTGERKVRLVGSSPSISEWINNEHPKRNDKNSYLFCNTYKSKNGDYRGKKLTHQAVYKILRNLKERSGFKKDINPHLFRHSRATELSEFLTDAQRCNYFGWEQGSQVCRVYTHIQDTNRAILELNGLIEKDKDKDGKFKNVICPRCKTSNPFGTEVCIKCSLGLDIKNVEKYEERDQLLKKILNPGELDNLIKNKLIELLKVNDVKNELRED
jgi:site-specific recombinase XerD